MFELSHLDQTTLARWEETCRSPGWTHSQSGETSRPKPDMLQLASVFHDSFTRLVFPLCSAAKDRPSPAEAITNSIYLVDASSLGLKQGWNLRSFAQNISWLLSACYPETIKHVFVGDQLAGALVRTLTLLFNRCAMRHHISQQYGST